MEAKVERLVNRLFRKYYPPSNSVFQWKLELAPRHKMDLEARLKQLLTDGYTVKTGWAATSVRGFHDHYIFYKKKEKNDGQATT